ncbi:MAG: DUF5011 domain-containing protein, partial [Candidatus Hydrogenedentes bacterium]|nr:DUF5011 domain-containing protein [Candidatus Hydrogenedentota bacterium]
AYIWWLGWTLVGWGGAGGNGGQGATGGWGGNGGDGGWGGAGGAGGYGGGAIILSARGLLELEPGAALDISATAAAGGLSGNAGSGGGGGSGPSGWTGNGRTDGAGPACWGVCGGYGGSGGWGGGAGWGGTGGSGGAGGAGGAGGRATPGMVKLHGSIVEASGAVVYCNNHTPDTNGNYLGRFTLISNMTTAKQAASTPSFNDDILAGTAYNDNVLTGPSLYDPAFYTPLIPTLEGGPATAGYTLPDYWNKERVDLELAGVASPQLVEMVRLTGDFESFDQVFLVNTSIVDTAAMVTVTVDGYAPIDVGFLAPGQVWTILVPVDMTASVTFRLDVGPQISVTGGPLNFGIHETGSGLTAAQRITLENTGTRDLLFSSVDVTGPDAANFSIQGYSWTNPMAPGQAGVVDIAFDPQPSGEKYADLTVVSNALNEPVVAVGLTGIADAKPTITSAEPSVTVECAGPSGAEAEVSVHVEDGDGDPLTVAWEVNGTLVRTDEVAASGPPTAADLSLNVACAYGSNTVRVTVFDQYIGQQSETLVTATVEDTVPPVITMAGATDITLEVHTPYVDAGASALDACDGDLTSQIAAANNVVNTVLGNYGVTYNVSDAAGNPATEALRWVHIVDTTPPVITLNGSDPLEQEVNTPFVDPGATAMDNYDGDISHMVAASGNVDASTLGAYTIAYDVADSSNNQAVTVTRTVVVQDTTPPEAFCKDYTAALDSAGAAAISANDIDGGSTDNYAIESIHATPNAFTCDNLGANAVTLTVQDTSGNMSTCVATVTVLDSLPPEMTVQNATIELDEYGAASVTAGQVDGGTSDNCEVASLSVAPDAFDCEDLGENPVVLTAADASGNEASAEAVVTVKDSIAPAASAQDITVTLDTAGAASIVAADIDAGSSDNCSVASRNVAPDTFSCADIGANPVTLTITDQSGNASTAAAVVTVVDTIVPAALAQDITVALDPAGMAFITASDLDAGSSDNCEVASMSVAPSSFGCANIGQNAVTLTVTDQSGNVSTASALVTVRDVTAPVAVCRDITVQLDASGDAAITAADIDAGSNDACGIAAASAAPTTFTCANVGANAVTLTVVDVNGNAASCVATVTVVDPVAPELTCPADVTLDADDSCTAPVPDLAALAVATDSCGIAGVAQSPAAGAAAPLGNTVVAITATDVNGNSTQCAVTVTVVDVTPPVVANEAVTPNPVAVNTPFVITATAADLCSNIVAAEYSLDGGATWLPMDPIGSPALSAGVSATVAGVSSSTILTVSVRGTDAAGNVSAPVSLFLPVYDPSGGFVTGGGWISSPPGAYALDPELTGKATFGFVSKYKKGANTPEGQTEFQFRAGNLNFHSSSYEWLVIAGAKALYKGVGTINGAGSYKFFLSAIDGDLKNAGCPDTFRIRIFTEQDGVETIVYDNLLGASMDADPTTVLGGGSIVVHK